MSTTNPGKSPAEELDPLAPEDVDAPHAEEPASDPVEKELAAAKEQALRALAEAENTRRRAQKDREEASRYGIARFARDLLDVADNLRRALESLPADNQDEAEAGDKFKSVIEGVEATERELLRAFEKNGIRQLDPAGEIFSPNFHEVMFETPGTGQPAGTIIQVIEKGYLLHDRLLRPARVGVAKDEGAAPPPGETPPGGHIDTQA